MTSLRTLAVARAIARPSLACAAAAVLLLIALGCGDTFRPIANPVLNPGGDPQAFDNIGVVNTNPAGVGTVQIFNVAGDTNTSTYDVAGIPGIAAVDSTQTFVFVPNRNVDSVTYKGGNITSPLNIALAPGSTPIQTISTSTALYTLNSGPTSDCPVASVGAINASTAVWTQNFCLASVPTYGIAVGTKLYIVSSAANVVYIVNISEGGITAVNVGTNPVFATRSSDSSYVYVVNQGSNDISIINVSTGAVTTAVTGGSGPTRAFFDRTFNRLYVVNTGSNDVSVLDASLGGTLTPLHAPVPVGPAPNSVTVLLDGSRVYVGNGGNNTVTVFSASSYVTRTLTVGADASSRVTWVDSSRDGSKVYAANVYGGNGTNAADTKNGTTVIRTSDDKVVTTIPSPKQNSSCEGTTTCPLQRPLQLIGGRS